MVYLDFYKFQLFFDKFQILGSFTLKDFSLEGKIKQKRYLQISSETIPANLTKTIFYPNEVIDKNGNYFLLIPFVFSACPQGYFYNISDNR